MRVENLIKLYFDDDSGKVIAVAGNGAEFEQSFEICKDCLSLAMVMKPMEVAEPTIRRCRCK